MGSIRTPAHLRFDRTAADHLYSLALERFVPERDALAKALRADGERDQAAEIAGLRKPSAAAWAVNQLVRGHPQRLADLFEAGDALRRAQRDVIDGDGDRRAMRAATERERAAVEVLVDTAGAEHRLSSATRDRIADTLHAGALDDEARAIVSQGRLERELRHAGLGIVEGDGGSVSPAPSAAGPKAPAVVVPLAPAQPGGVAGGVRGAVSVNREAESARHRELERERADVRRAARIAEGEARRRVERAARAVAVAQERRERALEALDQAEQSLAQARADADAAAAAHRTAQDGLERIQSAWS